MALFMSGIMSLVISVFNIGVIDSILWIWLKAWSFAFIVAFPTILLVSPIIKKLVVAVVIDEPKET
jgi:hypothetical protein